MAGESKSQILRRVIGPDPDDFEPGAARQILRIRLTRADISRVNKLSALARRGSLTPEQRAELEGYLQVGNVLTLLHSKARMALKRRSLRARRVR